MRKLTILCIILLSILFLTPDKSYSQFRLKLGPSVGLNFNIGTGSDLPKTATGFGLVVGGQVDMSFTPVVGIIANLQFYDNRSGSFSEDGTTGDGTPYTITTSNSLAYFMIEPLLKLSVPNSAFYFVVGPAIGFNIQGTAEQEVTSPQNNVTFQNGAKKISGTIQNTNARFEMKFGSGIDINLGGVYLAPQLTFGYGITTVQQNVSGRVLTIQALVTTKFSLL